jgi:ABC-type hemin transport system ATPase subunit
VAVLAVFHDLDAMHRLARRVVVMRHGRIHAQGPPADVLVPEVLVPDGLRPAPHATAPQPA